MSLSLTPWSLLTHYPWMRIFTIPSSHLNCDHPVSTILLFHVKFSKHYCPTTPWLFSNHQQLTFLQGYYIAMTSALKSQFHAVTIMPHKSSPIMPYCVSTFHTSTCVMPSTSPCTDNLSNNTTAATWCWLCQITDSPHITLEDFPNASLLCNVAWKLTIFPDIYISRLFETEIKTLFLISNFIPLTHLSLLKCQLWSSLHDSLLDILSHISIAYDDLFLLILCLSEHLCL